MTKLKVGIIGLGGIVGASVAHHLIERGWDNIVGIDNGIVLSSGDIGFAETYLEGLWDTEHLVGLLALPPQVRQHPRRPLRRHHVHGNGPRLAEPPAPPDPLIPLLERVGREVGLVGAVLPVDPEPGQLRLGDDRAEGAIGEAEEAAFLFIRIKRAMHFDSSGDHPGKDIAFLVRLAPDRDRVAVGCDLGRQFAPGPERQALFGMERGCRHLWDAEKGAVGDVHHPVGCDLVDAPVDRRKDVARVVTSKV